MKTYLVLSTNPYFNLAWEEYIFKHIEFDEDIFLIWQNETSLTLGRNQNIYEEINLYHTYNFMIPVVRRSSGGGTVFHDLGNINYSLITKKTNLRSNYEVATKGLVECLHSLGIPAYFSPKTDIKVEGFKVSGNAQAIFKDRLLHHGTLLFNADINLLQKALKPKDESIQSKGIKSNRTQVINLSQYTNLTLDAFKNYLMTYFNLEVHTLTSQDLMHIDELMHDKYIKDHWNYGESPESTIKKVRGDYEVELHIFEGVIQSCKIIYKKDELTSLSSSLLTMSFVPDVLLPVLVEHPLLFQMLFD